MVLETVIVNQSDRVVLPIPTAESPRWYYIYIPLTLEECKVMGLKEPDPTTNYTPALRLTVLGED